MDRESSLLKKPEESEFAALQSQYEPVRHGYETANQQVQNLTASRDKLTGIVRPKMSLPGDRSTGFGGAQEVSDTPGGVSALNTVNSQLAKAEQTRDSFIQPLRESAQKFRQYTDQTRSASLQRQVGVTPPPIARPAVPAQGATATAGVAAGAYMPKLERPPGPSAVDTTSDMRQVGGGRTDTNAPGLAFTNSQGRHAIAPPGVTVTKDAAGRPVFTATGESVAYASTPAIAAPSPVVAAPVSVVPAIQRPTFVGQAQGAFIENPDEEQRRLDIALSGATFAPARNRGARAAQAQMVDAISGQAAQLQQIEADANRAQLEAANSAGVAGMKEAGDTYRAELVNAGETERTREAQAGETIRERIKIKRPEFVTDAQGNYLSVDGARAAPVTDSQGQTIRMPLEGAITPAVQLAALAEQLSAEQQALQPNTSRITSLQQQIDALTAPRTATNSKTGERVRLNPRTGDWEAIR